MFDKLVESNSADADFKPRRKFFMVSTLVVGILFLTAVMISLYAQNIDIGTGQFEISELVAPVTPDAPEPEPPRQQQETQQNQSDLPSRQTNMARVDEPTIVPNQISSAQNTRISRPYGNFIFDPNAPESNGVGIPTGGDPTGRPPGSGTSASVSEPDENVKPTEPPPAVSKIEKPTTILKTSKIMNGEAVSLPKPVYSPVAMKLGIQDNVNVQITIGENGSVISAKAVTGNLLLREASERAARNAKFKPTILNDQPVKVTGVIVYKFTRN